MKKTAPATVHVSPDPAGGWLVRMPQSGATRTYPTQAEAVDAAQSSISRSGGQLSVRSGRGPARHTFTLGSAAMEKINAVEGVVLPGEVQEALASFDYEDFSPEQRRSELESVLTRKGKP